MKTLGFVMMGVLLAGCSGGFDDVPKDLCKKQHMDGEMAVCDELYDAAPYVHLPKDESDHVYAGAVGALKLAMSMPGDYFQQLKSAQTAAAA